MKISKSKYLLYKQCAKAGWLNVNEPGLVNDDNSRMSSGNEVGKVARNLFPGGELIVSHKKSLSEMIQKTKELIVSGATIIYEAAFESQNGIAVVDILVREENIWKLYEVKSSTSVKDRHIYDVAYQYLVLSECALKIESTNVVTVNNKYERQEELDVYELFNIEDVTKQVIDMQLEISNDIRAAQNSLSAEKPLIDIGIQCEKFNGDSSECPYKFRCWDHIPDNSVFEIGGMRLNKKMELYQSGILSIDDIPDNYKLSESQKVQVDSFKLGAEVIDKSSVSDFASEFSQDLYFIDFETFQQAVPQFVGLKPYEQIPFQYSLHISDSNGSLDHKEFLAKEGTDPRRDIAERLVVDIPYDVVTVAYNMKFEKMVLRQLANLFEDLSDHLMNIHDNMKDLMIPFQKKWIYKNDMRGSYSIKYVLPALFPESEELSYKKLEIQNGTMAMDIYATLHLKEPDEVDTIRRALLEYCKLDTLAMVRIWEYLKEIN